MNFRIAFGLSVLLVALRIFLLPAQYTWPVAGIIVLIWGWSWLLRELPDQAWIINPGFGIILAAVLLSTIGWNIYAGYIQPATPATHAAISHAKTNTDLEAALKINPSHVNTRATLLGHLQWIQEHLGARQAAKLAEIQRRVNSNELTLEAAWAQTQTVLAEEKQFREKSQSATAGLSAWNGGVGGSLVWLGIIIFGIGLAILILNALIPKFSLPGGKLLPGLGITVLVIGLALVYVKPLQDYVFSPAPAPPRAAATAKLPPLPQEIALQLVRGTLSQKVFPHPRSNDVKIRGPQGTYVQFSDGTKCPVKNLPARSKKWTSGFRLGNEANEGPVLITFS